MDSGSAFTRFTNRRDQTVCFSMAALVWHIPFEAVMAVKSNGRC
jgi:hypothetical protein